MAIDDSVLDTFDGTGALSAKWANAVGHPLYSNPPTRLSGEFAKTGVGNYGAAYWVSVPTSANCSVWAEFGSGIGYIWLGVRAGDLDSGEATDSYDLECNGADGSGTLYRIADDSYNQLGAFISGTGAFSAGQKIGLEANGTTITFQRNNGSGWSTVASRTDSNIAAAGHIYLIVDATTKITAFGGGPLDDDIGPSAPSSLSISNTTSSGTTLAFTMPSDADTTAYRVRRKDGTGQSFSSQSDGTAVTNDVTAGVSPGASITNVSVTGLSAATGYTLGVFAADDFYNWSSAATIDVTTLSAATGSAVHARQITTARRRRR